MSSSCSGRSYCCRVVQRVKWIVLLVASRLQKSHPLLFSLYENNWILARMGPLCLSTAALSWSFMHCDTDILGVNTKSYWNFLHFWSIREVSIPVEKWVLSSSVIGRSFCKSQCFLKGLTMVSIVVILHFKHKFFRFFCICDSIGYMFGISFFPRHWSSMTLLKNPTNM